MRAFLLIVSIYAVGVAADVDKLFWQQDVHDFPSTSLLQPSNPTVSFEAYYGNVKVKQGTRLSADQAKHSPDIKLDGDGVFALMLTDPDAPSPKHPEWANVLHWLLVNVPGGDIKQAREVLPYLPPSPPTGTHRYVFRLFRQPKGRAISVVDIPDRKHFDVHAWEKKYDLRRPEAVRYFRVSAAGDSTAPHDATAETADAPRQFELDNGSVAR